jgi:hypothetical protein
MTQRNTTHLSPTQRHALIIAGALTAFVLVLVGAIANRVTQEAALDLPSPTVAVPSTAIPAAGPDPVVQAMIDQRDAAYQQAIQEANDRLAQANDRLKQAYAAPPSPAQPAAPPQPTYLAADRAASLALLVAPGASVTAAPDLVNFQGTAAYEVVTDRGTVFVDATSGQILYNGAGVAAATGGGGGGGGEYDDDEHEDGEHEDDEHEDDEHEDDESDEGGHDD